MRPLIYGLALTLAAVPAAFVTAPAMAQAQEAEFGDGEILWDSFGVPHVYAETEEGAFYGFGYAQARNHGDILLRMYGESRGKGAEYWGEENEDLSRWLVANDVPELAAKWYADQTPQMRTNLDAFAAGINAFVAENPDALDPEAQRALPITGTDVIGHALRLMNYNYIASTRRVLVAPTINEAGGSNAWAIGPSRSASGNAMLLSNPHLPWAPSMLTYMEGHLNAPGMEIYGATQVGLPVLRFGFNRNLGFTNTVNTMVGYTRYELTLKDGGYEFDGEVLPFTTEEKSYQVRQEDGSFETVTFTQRYTVHGPVFELPDGKTTIALKVAGLDRPGVLQQYLDMGKSSNWDEFSAALKQMQVVMFNIVYADKDGHILYLDNGLLPKHDGGDVDYWREPVPGNTSETLWTELHSYDDLPKVFDPATGFVQNSNDPPWLSTWPRELDPADYPAYVAPVGPMSQRAQMGVKTITYGPKISFDDLMERKLNTRSLMADRMIPALVQAAEGNDDPDIVAAIELLEGWDHLYEADRRGALLFETWASIFAPNNFQSQENYAVKWSLDDPLETPRGLKDPEAAVAMLKEAVGKTIELYGAIDTPYGDVSRFHIGDVSVPGVGGYGNTGSFHVITWSPMKNGERTPLHGETWVSMVEFGETLQARGLMAYGNASQPDSPHRTDQLQMLSDKQYRTLWIDRADVEANLEEITEF